MKTNGEDYETSVDVEETLTTLEHQDGSKLSDEVGILEEISETDGSIENQDNDNAKETDESEKAQATQEEETDDPEIAAEDTVETEESFVETTSEAFVGTIDEEVGSAFSGNVDEDGSNGESSATDDLDSVGGKMRKKAIGVAIILAVLIIAAGLALLFFSGKSKDTPNVTQDEVYDVGDSPFISDSDSISVDNFTDDVIGVGVLYGDAPVYDKIDGKEVGKLPAQTTLMIFAADKDYYKVTDADRTLSGYIKKDEVNTGGIDIGNYNAGEEIVDDKTGEIINVIYPEDSTESTTTKSTTTKSTTTKSTTAKSTTAKSTTAKSTTAKSKSTTTKPTAAKVSSVSTTTATTTVTTTKKTTTTTNKPNPNSPENFPVNTSPYFVYVEKGSHTITIYAKDSHGKYTTAVRTYLTATGRTASLTPVGLFSVGGKEKWHRWGNNSYSPYCSKYYGGLFFHGPLYTKKNFGSLKENSVSAIGTNASSGCMRTSAQAAYFIYAFCPSGTYVKIVNGSPLGKGAGKPSIESQYVDPATNKVPVAGVSLKNITKTVKIGESFTVKADVSPDNASEKACYWISNNPKSVAVKSSGISCTITAKTTGKAVVTVTTVDGSYKASITVTVIEPTTTTTTTTTTAKPTETTVSTTKATQSTDSTTKATRSTDSTTKATQSTDSTTKTQSTDSTTKATQSTDSTTKATQSTDSTTKATQSTDSTTKATQSTVSTTKATQSTDSTTKATQSTTKATQSTTKASQSTTKASQSTTKASQSTTKATQSTTKATQSTTKVTESHTANEP